MISKEQFLKYEKVRKSGKTNMIDIGRVSMLSGLMRDQIKEIVEDYENLANKYLDGGQ